MLPSLATAFGASGKIKKDIAAELGKTPQTVYGWCSGRFYINPRLRYLIETATGVKIDWQAYEAEYSGRAALPEPQPEPPADDPPPPPAPPQMPRPAPQRPATAPRRTSATPPDQKSQSAHVARSGGFFGWLTDPTDNGMKFE